MRIPADALAPDTLRSVVEEFVTREGTDYGDGPFTLEQKVAHVMRQLADGTATVEYDEQSETCTVIPLRT